MEKLKCTSCGGNLEVEENKEYAVCAHCGAKYKLNKDLNVNIRLDENMKDIVNKGLEVQDKFVKPTAIEIVVIIIIGLIVFSIVLMFNTSTRTTTPDTSFNDYEEKINNLFEKGEEKAEENFKSIEEDANKDFFNIPFEHENGTQNAIFVKSTLDEIVRSNNKYERKIVLVFNETETTEETEIVNIKQSLEGDYEVSINYDEDGYVNKVIINKIY